MTATDTRTRSSAGAAAGGRRSARLARERRRRLRQRLGLVVLGLAVAVVAGAAMLLLADRLDSTAGTARGGAEVVGSRQQTLLLVQHGGEGAAADSVTLLAAGEEAGFVLFLPVGTLMDIPGVGLDRLGLAQQYGGAALVQSTVENALGVRIDHVADVTDAGLGAWLDRLGGLEVDVPTRLVERRNDGSADVRFEPGRQQLDGGRLAELWSFSERGEEQLAALARQQRVLDALMGVAADGEARAQLLEGGAPQLATEAEEAWMDGLLAGLAAARGAERLRFSVLPVEPFGGDGSEGGATYRMREGETRGLVTAHLAGSLPATGGDAVVRVQVLNGVGVPGVGQQVDQRLERGAFRIVLTDNARSFDFTTTQIVVYDESEASLAAARRVQELLGVGTIQVSRQPQSVIDLTIVVGADFVAESG